MYFLCMCLNQSGLLTKMPNTKDTDIVEGKFDIFSIATLSAAHRGMLMDS